MRFDPDAELVGHLISDGQVLVGDAESASAAWDADGRASGASPRDFGLHSAEQAAGEEYSASIGDEPVSLVACLVSQCSGQTCGDGHGSVTADRLGGPCCPTWEAQVDALFLWQGNIPSRPLYVESATRQTALDANQLQNVAAIAPRYAVIYNHDQCRAIEVNYFQVWGFDASRQIGPQVNGQGSGVFTGSNLAGLDLAGTSAATAMSSAHIQSLEVNLRRRNDGFVQWISGFRWLEWGQNLGIDATRITTPQQQPTTVFDSLDVGTLNNLYGWQWGGDMMVWNAGRWLRVNGVGKAGVYYNHQASQSRSYTTSMQPVTALSAANDTVSFVGEAGINGSWSITNWLSWRAGYSFFWLSGMAVPANQLGFTNVAAVNTNGSVYLHGVTTGLEARW